MRTLKDITHFQMDQDRQGGLGESKQVKYVQWIYLLTDLLQPGSIPSLLVQRLMGMHGYVTMSPFLFHPIPSHLSVLRGEHGYQFLVNW